MQRVMVIIATLLSMIGNVYGEVFNVGSGTALQAYHPFDTSSEYGWSKAIYSRTELTASGLRTNQQIFGIGFEIGTNPGLVQLQNNVVYIKNTSFNFYTSASYVDPVGYRQIFNSDFALSGGGWVYLFWDEPFIYSGNNIEILWEQRSGIKSGFRPQFFSSSTSGVNLCAYNTSSSGFPLQNGLFSSNRANLRIFTNPEQAPGQAIPIYPAQFQKTINPVQLSWILPHGTQSSWDIYLGTQNPPPFLGKQVSNRYIQELQPGTEYFWRIVPRNIAGSATDCPVWSFTTAGANDLCESFESVNFPPPGWTVEGDLYRDNVSAYHGLYLLRGTPSASVRFRLISPKLVFDSNSVLAFQLKAYAQTGNGRIRILIQNDDGSAFQVGEIISMPTNTNWQSFSINLGEVSSLGLSGKIVFEFWSAQGSTGLAIDHIIGPSIFVNLSSPQNPQISRTESGLLLNWELVTGASSYQVFRSSNLQEGSWELLGSSELPAYEIADAEADKAFYRIKAVP